jgi:hypothetical protein
MQQFRSIRSSPLDVQIHQIILTKDRCDPFDLRVQTNRAFQHIHKLDRHTHRGKRDKSKEEHSILANPIVASSIDSGVEPLELDGGPVGDALAEEEELFDRELGREGGAREAPGHGSGTVAAPQGPQPWLLRRAQGLHRMVPVAPLLPHRRTCVETLNPSIDLCRAAPLSPSPASKP